MTSSLLAMRRGPSSVRSLDGKSDHEDRSESKAAQPSISGYDDFSMMPLNRHQSEIENYGYEPPVLTKHAKSEQCELENRFGGPIKKVHFKDNQMIEDVEEKDEEKLSDLESAMVVDGIT